jgi:hypothetical protein
VSTRIGAIPNTAARSTRRRSGVSLSIRDFDPFQRIREVVHGVSAPVTCKSDVFGMRSENSGDENVVGTGGEPGGAAASRERGARGGRRRWVFGVLAAAAVLLAGAIVGGCGGRVP